MKSNFGKLNLRETGKGLFLAILGAMVTFLYNFIVDGGDIFDAFKSWRDIVSVGLTTGLLYIMTTLGSNSNGAILKKEKK